jgi:hypothetical protein
MVMNLVEIISYIVVPLICLIGFPCVVLMVSFCFNMNGKVSKLESDYRHLDKNMKMGLSGVQAQLDTVIEDIKTLLKHAGESS